MYIYIYRSLKYHIFHCPLAYQATLSWGDDEALFGEDGEGGTNPTSPPVSDARLNY